MEQRFPPPEFEHRPKFSMREQLFAAAAFAAFSFGAVALFVWIR